MKIEELLQFLREAPLIASVQASPGSPLDDRSMLLQLARASLENGAWMLRLEGSENINTIKILTQAPVIGLIKRAYPDSEVYITPTRREVEELLGTRCEVIALDATQRPRPNDENLADLIQMVKAAGRIVMADVDHPLNAKGAFDLGADIVSTTLSGYTDREAPTRGPDLRMLHHYVALGPTLIEGRISRPAEVRAAMRMGASGVVVGGALNNPVKQTRLFASAALPVAERVGAVDVGGTWLRWAVAEPIHYTCFGPVEAAYLRMTGPWRDSASRSLSGHKKIRLPDTHSERLQWIEEQINETGMSRVGVSAGGTINPSNGRIWESSELIPGQKDQFWQFSVPSIAINDGLATAWAHAGVPALCDRRVFTVAIGTGLGGGFTNGLELNFGRNGQYPRINDVRLSRGRAEDILGGKALNGKEPSNVAEYIASLKELFKAIKGLYAPDDIVLCGGVGLASWLWEAIQDGLGDDLLSVSPSPFGADAGLHGAAALALWPPELP